MKCEMIKIDRVWRTKEKVRRLTVGEWRLTIGERIMWLRSERGYSRGQLAQMANISEKFLYEIELGKKGFSAMTLLNLSEALEVSLDYIMTGTKDRKYDDEIIKTLGKFKPNTLKTVNRLLKVAYEISKNGK